MLKGLNGTTPNLAGASRGVSAPLAAEPRLARRRFTEIAREQPRTTAVEASAPAGPLASNTAPARAQHSKLEIRLSQAISRRQHMERVFQRVLRGKDTSPQQLLQLQLQVQKYAAEVETASRVVERLTSAVKQTLNTQV